MQKPSTTPLSAGSSLNQANGPNWKNMFGSIFKIILLLLLPTSLFATTTVTGKMQTLGTGNITSNAFMRFWLRGCAGNQPRVNGTGLIGPTQGGIFYFDIAADSGGNVTGTVYSTRDSAGTGNGDIECGGSKTAVWYGLQSFVAGKGGPEVPVHAKSGQVLDITQVTPITTNPVVTSPTGDTTYLRLDAGNAPVVGNLNVTGGISSTAPGTIACFSTLMSVVYVGGTCNTAWGSGDIGAQINTAYAALPSNGGKIVVTPQSNGACYTFTTPIVLTTSSKFVLLEGFSGDSQAAGGATSNGACLDYTPTTATTAITMDYVPSAGGGTTRNHGIRNLRLVNNNCITTGGCGSSAVGVSCTTVNAGCQNASWDNWGVVGFGTGIKISVPASNSQASWGINFSRGSLSFNTTGLNIPVGIELTMLDDVKILGNATGVTMGGSSDFYMNGGSCDSNTTICVVSSGGSLSFEGVHFEGLGQNNMNMVNASLAAHIHGGFALDDCVSAGACGGVTPAYWFQAQSLDVVGQDIFTAGRIPTQVYKYSSEAHVTGIKNISNVFPHDNVINTTGGNAVFNQMNGGFAAIEASLFMASGGTSFSCSEVGSITGWGASGACSNPQGGQQRFQFTMTAGGAGITVNPTVLITLTSPWPKTPLYLCKMVGGTATQAHISGEQTSLSVSTIGPLAYIGTPTAPQTVIISCIGI